LLCPEAHVGVDPPGLVNLGRLSLVNWRELEQTLPGGVGLVDLDWLGIRHNVANFSPDTPLPANAERLDPAQVASLVPGLSQPTDGVFVRQQARVNPLRAIARMATSLASVIVGVDVQAVSTEASRIRSVHTSIGEISPGAVVFATGLSPRIAGLELDLPSFEVKGHIFASEPTTLELPGAVAPLATAIDDGRLLLGGTLDIGDDERVVRPEVIAGMWSELEAAWPVARGVKISHQWACFRPAHPDHLPVIDRVPGLDNGWVTSGHYKTGILMAPATGRALAAWIDADRRPSEVEGLGAQRSWKLEVRSAASA
jgi:glycine/D-amino acid oxidase-like deaminating enzyme